MDLVIGCWAHSEMMRDAHFCGNFSDCLLTLGFLCVACIVGGYAVLEARYSDCPRVATRGPASLVCGDRARHGSASGLAAPPIHAE